jgi:hypothetical protein
MIKLSKPVKYQINCLCGNYKLDTVIYANVAYKLECVILELIDTNLNEPLEDELL